MVSLSLDGRIMQWLVRDARSLQPDIRERALDRLGALSDTVEPLVAGLLDGDPEIRSAAAANLGRVRRADAWPPLLHAAHIESSDDVLCQVLGALAAYQDPSISDALIELLARRDRDYRVRMEVVLQLWKYDPSVVRPELAKVVLSDDNDIVRAHAADSLELLDKVQPADPGRHQVWLRISDDQAPGVAAAVARALRDADLPLTGSVLEAISRRLHHVATDERALALHRLSMLAPTSAATLAIPLLEDVHQDVKVACCDCLGAIRDPIVIPALLATLRSAQEPRVRVATLLGLENYHAAPIGKILLDMLEAGTASGDALAVLCRQLWKYPSARTIALLRQVLASSIKLPHRAIVEDTLAFLARLDDSEP